MPKKKDDKDKVEDPRYKGSGILIDPALTGGWRGVRRKDWLDRELEEEERMEAQDMRKMRIEEAKARRRKRIIQLQKEIEELDEDDSKEKVEASSGANLAMAKELSRLPDKEKQKVVQTYAMIKQAEKSGNDMSGWLPMLIGFTRENPEASKNDMLDYIKAMNEMTKMNVDMVRGNQPQTGAQNNLEYIKLFKDMFQDTLKKPLEDMEERLQPRYSPFEQILLNPELYERAQNMGLFGGQKSSPGETSELDLKLEQMRQQHDLKMKEFDLQNKKMMMEQQSKQERNQNLLQALLPLSGLLAGPANKKMRQLGQSTAKKMPNPDIERQEQGQGSGGKAGQETQPVAIKCLECGYEGVENLPIPIPDQLKCPACNTTLVMNRSDEPGEA